MKKYDLFKVCEVKDVKTVEEFLDRYYKPERYTGRGPEYAATLLASYKEDIRNFGCTHISQFDSVTGKVVSFYPEKSKAPAPNAFEKWLDTFIEEKGIDLDQVFEIEGGEYGTNFIPCSVVIEHIKIASKSEQKQIKKVIVKIDFCNGDVVDYFKHLAKAIAI